MDDVLLTWQQLMFCDVAHVFNMLCNDMFMCVCVCDIVCGVAGFRAA
jgi:hypothetical protein